MKKAAKKKEASSISELRISTKKKIRLCRNRGVVNFRTIFWELYHIERGSRRIIDCSPLTSSVWKEKVKASLRCARYYGRAKRGNRISR